MVEEINERVIRIELTSSAWKADIISHYTTPAEAFPYLRGYAWSQHALSEAKAAEQANKCGNEHYML